MFVCIKLTQTAMGWFYFRMFWDLSSKKPKKN